MRTFQVALPSLGAAYELTPTSSLNGPVPQCPGPRPRPGPLAGRLVEVLGTIEYLQILQRSILCDSVQPYTARLQGYVVIPRPTSLSLSY